MTEETDMERGARVRAFLEAMGRAGIDLAGYEEYADNYAAETPMHGLGMPVGFQDRDFYAEIDGEWVLLGTVLNLTTQSLVEVQMQPFASGLPPQKSSGRRAISIEFISTPDRDFMRMYPGSRHRIFMATQAGSFEAIADLGGTTIGETRALPLSLQPTVEATMTFYASSEDIKRHGPKPPPITGMHISNCRVSTPPANITVSHVLSVAAAGLHQFHTGGLFLEPPRDWPTRTLPSPTAREIIRTGIILAGGGAVLSGTAIYVFRAIFG